MNEALIRRIRILSVSMLAAFGGVFGSVMVLHLTSTEGQPDRFVVAGAIFLTVICWGVAFYFPPSPRDIYLRCPAKTILELYQHYRFGRSLMTSASCLSAAILGSFLFADFESRACFISVLAVIAVLSLCQWFLVRYRINGNTFCSNAAETLEIVRFLDSLMNNLGSKSDPPTGVSDGEAAAGILDVLPSAATPTLQR